MSMRYVPGNENDSFHSEDTCLFDHIAVSFVIHSCNLTIRRTSTQGGYRCNTPSHAVLHSGFVQCIAKDNRHSRDFLQQVARLFSSYQSPHGCSQRGKLAYHFQTHSATSSCNKHGFRSEIFRTHEEFGSEPAFQIDTVRGVKPAAKLCACK